MTSVETFYNCQNILGEGIIWSQQNNSLYWLDIPMPSKLYKCSFNENKFETFNMPEMITALAERSDNNLLIASHYGINNFNTTNKDFKKILEVEKNKPHNRCNDGAADYMGNFWFGTMQNNIAADGSDTGVNENTGSLYCIDKNFNITTHETEVGISNTFAWSPNNDKFYFSDTITGIISVYDYDSKNRTITNKKDFAKFDRGYPDGSTVDADGFLWNCRWGGSCVVRFNHKGEVDTVIEMPVPNITSCTFGGKDLKTLFVTTAKMGMSDEEKVKYPEAGNVFAINTNYQGKPDFKFAN